MDAVTLITNEQGEVLSHTLKTGRYVTGDEMVIQMGVDGLLRDHGPQMLAEGDHYFTMTSKGREALRAWLNARPVKPAPKPMTAAMKRYAEFLDADSGMKFGEWLKWQERRRKEGLLAH